jgi:hypothetical protein
MALRYCGLVQNSSTWRKSVSLAALVYQGIRQSDRLASVLNGGSPGTVARRLFPWSGFITTPSVLADASRA